jgi:hypothetical protein
MRFVAMVPLLQLKKIWNLEHSFQPKDQWEVASTPFLAPYYS